MFKPEPGKLLNAVVNKITDHHFGCVGCFNCSVYQPNIDVLTDEQRDVVSNIAIGDNITFKVWKFDVHHGIMFVLGDIASQFYQHSRHKLQLLESDLVGKNIKQESVKC